MASYGLGMVPPTIYKDGDFFRSTSRELEYVTNVAHEGSNGDEFKIGEILTLTINNETPSTGWTYLGKAYGIDDEQYIVVNKGNFTYVLRTGETNTPGNVVAGEKEVPQKISDLDIRAENWFPARFIPGPYG